MILGTGIDIIEIDRMRKAIERWGDAFLTHVFNEEEIAYAQGRKYPAQHFAARFAAKEAVLKAVRDNAHLHWKDIVILHDEHGAPVCTLKKADFDKKILISISHSHNYAVASAIITS